MGHLRACSRLLLPGSGLLLGGSLALGGGGLLLGGGLALLGARSLPRAVSLVHVDVVLGQAGGAEPTAALGARVHWFLGWSAFVHEPDVLPLVPEDGADLEETGLIVVVDLGSRERRCPRERD